MVSAASDKSSVKDYGLLYGHSEKVAEWVKDRIPQVETFGPCSAIGVMSEGRLIAGVVYHDYRAQFGTIQLSMAADSPMWARKDLIGALLAYPFGQLECYKCRLIIPADNALSIRNNEHIGFKREAILAHEFGKGRHAHIYRMIKPDFEKIYGEEQGGS